MTNKWLIAAGFVLILSAGCAKKQLVRPAHPDIPSVEDESAKGEPSIRFGDWQPVPEIGKVYFDYDQSELGENARATLKKNANYLKEHSELNILVEGYCDERGTIEYNLALGQRRAASVREYYGQLGVSLGRLGTISYGEENPADPSNNEAAWALNRRVETKVRPSTQTSNK